MLSAEEGLLRYRAVKSEGKSGVEKKVEHGYISADFGSWVELLTDPGCVGCSAQVVEVQGEDGEIPSLKGLSLPVILRSGSGTLMTKPGRVSFSIDVKAADSTAAPRREHVVIRFAGKTPWWSVTDTIAYAVTRQQGSTAVAGVGAFVQVPKARWLQYAFVFHLLPPGPDKEGPEMGIAPIGLGFFDGRIVMGVGWNVSRKSLRPSDHDRYVYIGVSASKLINPKPPTYE
jgi:hypothetical protein